MKILRQLQQQGMTVLHPESVYIAPDVQLSRISCKNGVIYPGCRLEGAETLILDGVELGAEGPVHVKNCLLGTNVALKGGYFEGAVFLSGAQLGLGAHVRPGTILEEQARGAHCVALKQTLLFPFVTLGSLINFCDCFMAGGTGASDHSEVGSSFIHFNYTPNQDKATPSLMGDVPRGVMLDQHPIFLGGQGGIVGPCRVEYGTTIAAGATTRHDMLTGDQLVMDGLPRAIKRQSIPGKYTNIQRILVNNLHCIANLAALDQWYRHVRGLFVGESFPAELLAGLQNSLKAQIDERIHRLAQLAEKMSISQHLCRQGGREHERQKQLHQRWAQIHDALAARFESTDPGDAADKFLLGVKQGDHLEGRAYLDTIRALPPETKAAGRQWLQQIVDAMIHDIQMILPAFSIQ